MGIYPNLKPTVPETFTAGWFCLGIELKDISSHKSPDLEFRHNKAEWSSFQFKSGQPTWAGIREVCYVVLDDNLIIYIKFSVGFKNAFSLA